MSFNNLGDCGICHKYIYLNVGNVIKIQECCHIFHDKCLKNYVYSGNDTCPCCNKEFDTSFLNKKEIKGLSILSKFISNHDYIKEYIKNEKWMHQLEDNLETELCKNNNYYKCKDIRNTLSKIKKENRKIKQGLEEERGVYI